MCGLAGFVDPRGASGDAVRAIARMTATLVHRGPDDAGSWVDVAAGVALGHRRLSIIDLSPAGHQPMVSDSGRYVIVYNGEIYNHREVRHALDAAPEGRPYRGHSDTEVVLKAVERWGVRRALDRFVGMFAGALWDRHERVLHLLRDRMGEKPLYYGWTGGTLLFGSELKAMAAHPSWEGHIDDRAVALMMRYGYIPAPHSIYRGIFKLPAASLLSIPYPCLPGMAVPVKYWSARTVVTTGARERFSGSAETAATQLDSVLRRAIAEQAVADVPVGAFLSGGIDSSLVVSLMQAQSTRPVRTFTIGSHDPHYDEAPQARRIAGHLGTLHTELYASDQDALAVVPTLPTVYDEPFGDASQVPAILVAKLTRQHVTVSLSGDGGDELFCGYARYALLQSLWRRATMVPRVVRPAVAATLSALDPIVSRLERLETRLPRPLHCCAVRWPRRAHWLATKNTPEGLYRDCVAHWRTGLFDGPELPTALTDPAEWAELPDPVERAMFMDLVGYLPDDIMVKVDRASMAVGLEARAPFLDHRIVEFAARLPLDMKMRDGRSKWVLRQVLAQYVPPALVEGPKRGFLVGFGRWLRGPLRDWAEALLDERRLRTDGFLDPSAVRTKWAHYLSTPTSPWNNDLWHVLMFQSWLHSDTRAARPVPRFESPLEQPVLT